MRQVTYGGAMSLDGFIAGPHGEHDWIVMDPEIDFAEMMAQYDTFLIGRKTFVGLIRFRGHLPRGGYDVPHAQSEAGPPSAPAVH